MSSKKSPKKLRDEKKDDLSSKKDAPSNNQGILVEEEGVGWKIRDLAGEMLNQTHPKFSKTFATRLMQTGSIDQFIDNFKTHLDSGNCEDPNEYDHLGFYMVEAGRFEEAVEIVEKAITIEPGNPKRLGNLAFCLQKMDRFDDAIKIAKNALELDPNNIASLNGLAECLYLAGRHEEAIRFLEKVIELKPDNPNHYANLAQCLEHESERLEEACQAAESAAKIDPGAFSDLYLRLKKKLEMRNRVN